MACQECGNTSDGIIDGLCSSCTIKKHGSLFPWLEQLKKQGERIESALDYCQCGTRQYLEGPSVNPHCGHCGKRPIPNRSDGG